MERERIIEIILGAIFITLLIMMIILFVIASEVGKSSEKQTLTITISGSYNTYNNYNNYPVKEYGQLNQIYTSKKYPVSNYDYLKYEFTENHEMRYGFFGNEINDYKVYVKNKEHKGGYFTVKFYLTDHYGKTLVESMTHYLKPHEVKRFAYKNVYSNGKEYNFWSYKIVSNTKI